MPISPPVQIAVPFATSGLKNAIPANTNNVTGNAGYDAGFGVINMTPKTAGGIPPFGQDFNGIFYDVTLALQFLEAGGTFPFNSGFATAIGGYPIGAIVSRTDNTGVWRNTVANNSTNPETFGAGWQPEGSGSTSVTMTNANVTLTALQGARSIIIISGALTANLQLIMPNYTTQWLIVNNCTGAFSITVKTTAGSGPTIGIKTSQTVYGDGTNIYSTLQSTLVAGDSRNVACSVTAASASAVITADEFAVKTALGGASWILSGLSKTINLSTTGAGGMDTGAAPVSGAVGVYAIYNPSTSLSATNPALLAVNATAARVPEVYGGVNMPSGYTASALIGVFPTNASSQFPVLFMESRNVGLIATQVLSTTTAQASNTPITMTPVPLNAVAVNVAWTLITGGSATLDFTISASATGISTVDPTLRLTSAALLRNGNGTTLPIIVPRTCYYTFAASGGATLTVYTTGYRF